MSQPEARLSQIVTELRDNGHRMTPQRMAVLRVLIESQEHLTAEQIYESVQAGFPMTSLATIYKTIALLKKMDEVLEINAGDRSRHYDGNKPYSHPHLICTRCGTIIDVETDQTERTREEIARRTGYRDVDCQLNLLGICPDCQRSEEQRPSVRSSSS